MERKEKVPLAQKLGLLEHAEYSSNKRKISNFQTPERHMIFQTYQTYCETLGKIENRYRKVHKTLQYHKHIKQIKINMSYYYIYFLVLLTLAG